MATNITTSAPREISTELYDRLISGVADSRASTPVAGGGGKPLLRLLKSGLWVYGQMDDPVQDGSEWAINPLSVRHGWVCWSDYPGNTKNELLGENMTPIFEKKPAMPDPIGNGDFAWKDQWACEMRCLNGEDEGVEVLFKTSSIGGLRAADNFKAALESQLKRERESAVKHPVAVVQLEVADYQHAKYGQIFNPVLTIVDWVDMNGVRNDEAAAAEEKPAAAPPPVRPSAVPRRQRPVGRV